MENILDDRDSYDFFISEEEYIEKYGEDMAEDMINFTISCTETEMKIDEAIKNMK